MCVSCGDNCVSCLLSRNAAYYSKNTTSSLVKLTASISGQTANIYTEEEAGGFFETAVNFYQSTLRHDFYGFSIYTCHIILLLVIKLNPLTWKGHASHTGA